MSESVTVGIGMADDHAFRVVLQVGKNQAFIGPDMARALAHSLRAMAYALDTSMVTLPPTGDQENAADG